MIDAHAHLGDEWEIDARIRGGVRTLMCGTDPDSARSVLAVCAQRKLFTPCCALHPWKAGAYAAEDMLPWLDQCPVVGETGLDAAWCDTPMRAQIEALIFNLDYAQRTLKPVVLHTKGAEQEVARILRPYTVRKLVHWYSCDRPPLGFLDQDCYFTIGPDVRTNPAVRRVAALAPLERLLIESDGMEAVRWARSAPAPAEALPEVLRDEARAIAEIRGIAAEAAEAALERNYDRFLGGAG